MGAGRQEVDTGEKGRRDGEKVPEKTVVGREEREETIGGQVQFSLDCFQSPAGADLLHLRGTKVVKNATE